MFDMKDTLKRIKADVILSAVLCVILGVVMVIWSDETINVICMLLAAGLVVMGAAELISYFIGQRMIPFSAVTGLIFILVGIWLFTKPEYIAMIIPIVIGVILSVHGIVDIKLSFESKGNGYEKWWSSMLLGLISFILGILCIVKAFGVASFAMKFIGIALIYDGISDLWIASRVIKTAKRMKQEESALDVEYKEVDD